MNPNQLLQKLAARTSWLTSKKFLAMLLGIATLCVSRFWPQQAEFATQIAAIVGVYIGIQGGADMVQKNAEGRALAAYLTPVEPPQMGSNPVEFDGFKGGESATVGESETNPDADAAQEQAVLEQEASNAVY